MLKKVLCWLLIFQHINVYVLQASPGDIKIIFERQEEQTSRISKTPLSKKEISSQSSSLFLRVLKKNQQGKVKQLFKSDFEVNSHSPLKFKPLQVMSQDPKDMRVRLISSNRGLQVSSGLKGEEFSLYLKPDGTVFLQKINLLNNRLYVETFGNIQTRNKIKAKGLSLVGKEIRNNHKLFVENLNLSAEGEVKNASEGKIYIGQQAHISRGNFINEGQVIGSDQSYIHLHGNDFTNAHIGQTNSSSFRSKISWNGYFSIEDVGAFINDSSILPLNEKEEHGLYIDGKILWNRGDIRSQILSLRFSADLLNDNFIKGMESLSIDVDQSLKNRGQILAPDTFTLEVGDFKNKKGGTIRGGKGFITVQNGSKNKGSIFLRDVTMVTGSLHNFGGFYIQETGVLNDRGTLDGFINDETGRLISKESLEIIGTSLKNKACQESRGTIRAHSLTTQLTDLTNEGDLIVKKKGELHVERALNEASGIIRLLKGHLFSIELTNEGKILGQTLFVTVSGLFKNAQGALVKFLQVLGIEGTGDIENEGTFEGKKELKINSGSLVNGGHILSEQQVAIRTQKRLVSQFGLPSQDFVNDGLVQAPEISLNVQEGLNTGKKLDEPKGVMALNFMSLTVGKLFSNRGHLFGKKVLKLKGTGRVRNEDGSVMETEGLFRSLLKGFQNFKGTIQAGQTLVFEKLTEELRNTGALLSEGDVKINSTSLVFNEGLIRATLGPIVLFAETLINYQLINTLGSILQIQVHDGENYNILFGLQGISLAIGALFTNFKMEEGELGKLESEEGSIIVKGQGILKNLGLLKAEQDIDLSSGLENHGKLLATRDVVTQTEEKKFINASSGEVDAERKIVIHNTSLLANKGHIQGQESSIVSSGDFENEGHILVSSPRK